MNAPVVSVVFLCEECGVTVDVDPAHLAVVEAIHALGHQGAALDGS